MHRFQSRDGQPYNFTDGLVVKGIDLAGDDGFKAISMKLNATDTAPTTLYDWMVGYTSKHVDELSPYDPQFGAKGDGSDDTIALQAWLDAIGTDVIGTGKLGVVPDGIFRHYSKLVFNKQYYYIKGAGSQCSQLRGPGFVLKSTRTILSTRMQDLNITTTDHITQVSFTGSLAANILTVTSISGGTLGVNARLSLPLESDYTDIYITEVLTGTGGVGTYKTNKLSTSNDSYPAGTTFLATSGPSPIDVSSATQYIIDSTFSGMVLAGVEHAFVSSNFSNSRLEGVNSSSLTLAPILLNMQGNSELHRNKVSNTPSYQPAFRLYGRGNIHNCHADSNSSTTRVHTFFAILGANSYSKCFSRDFPHITVSYPDFSFKECYIDNFGHAGIVVDGPWRRLEILGGGIDRTDRSDGYYGILIVTCGPQYAGSTIDFKPSQVNLGTGTITQSSMFDMTGSYAAPVNIRKTTGFTNETHFIDRTGLVPVLSKGGVLHQSISAIGYTVNSTIGSYYKINKLASRINQIEVNRYTTKSITISGSAAVIDVTGVSKVKLSALSGAKLHRATFVNASGVEYDATGRPITARFTGDITNGTAGIAGNLLNVTSIASGTIMIGTTLSGTGVVPGTTVTGYGTGTGGIGTYYISTSQLASSGASSWLTYHSNGNDLSRNAELIIEFTDVVGKILHSTSGAYSFRLTAGVDYTPPYAGVVLSFLWSETLEQYIQQ